MPTIWRERGFDFMIHTEDHEPAHIHAYKAGGVVQINIRDMSLRKVIGLKKSDVRSALDITGEQQVYFLEKWEEYHGED